MHFYDIKTAVARQFERMQQSGKLFRTDVSKDDLWDTYLASFPAGTNPIFRERTEHDCSCCRQFIKAVGNVVAVIDGKLETIWDNSRGYEAAGYEPVMAAMSALVRSKDITDLFLHEGRSAGTDRTFEEIVGEVKTWDHFHVNVKPEFVAKRSDIPTRLGAARSMRDVVLRGLREITDEAVETTLELIGQGSLYRGEEHRAAVTAFRDMKAAFKTLSPLEQQVFGYSTTLKIRNTAIGTLLVNLSEGMDLEHAVRAFEAVMAPANYKRPTALVTQAMIDKAKATVEELGLTSALERRYAVASDITVNNVLFADRSSRVAMGGAFDDLPTRAVTQNFDKVEEVTVDRFLSEILPRAESLEVLVENRHGGNLVSLIAPVDPTSGHLFKWDNNFSWSYSGEVADSLRERVVAAGGRVDGVLRFSHTWNYAGRNASLMDLHVFLPGCSPHKDGQHDSYPIGQRVGWNNRRDHLSGGVQDVDYVNPAPEGYIPVENITFPDLKRLPNGKYVFKIHNWNLRPPTDSGVKAEIAFGGQSYEYEITRAMKHKEWVTLAEVELMNGQFTISHKLDSKSSSRELWRIHSEKFHKVNAVMLSPNHWDGQGVGNRHLFFMLDGCKNDGTARGFFNEFLRESLNLHRKVFEIVGAKMKVPDSDAQLSGLGFSSTVRNALVVKVKGAFNRTVKVLF